MSTSDVQSDLSLKNVTKIFPSGLNALASTEFQVAKGDFVSLVGPSGCGKSTLLRLISGLVKPTEGTVNTSDNAKIGFVFQEPTLMPWSTVSENVALPMRLEGLLDADSQQRIATVLEWVGLEEFHNAYPRQLSGGMKMRASIARALIVQPDLLLLDEPFAALDEFTRAQLNDDLLGLWEQQKWTSILVTHSIREAAYLSNRILVMSPRPGRVVADVTVPFAHPRSPMLRNDHAFTDLCASVAAQLEASLAEAEQ